MSARDLAAEAAYLNGAKTSEEVRRRLEVLARPEPVAPAVVVDPTLPLGRCNARNGRTGITHEPREQRTWRAKDRLLKAGNAAPTLAQINAERESADLAEERRIAAQHDPLCECKKCGGPIDRGFNHRRGR